MLKINKYFLIAFVLIISIIGETIAQNSTSSPYSRYGIGEISSKSFGRDKAMGGLSIAMRSSLYVNPSNPASLSAIKPNSFIFELSIQNSVNKFSTSSLSHSSSDANIKYMGVGFPVTKWWGAGFGLKPFSSVGYKVIETQNIGDDVEIRNTYEGSGGLNQFYFANSVKLFNKLSIGANFSYIFGSIDRLSQTALNEGLNYSVITARDRVTLRDMYINMGIQYHGKINKKYSFVIGATYDNKTDLKARVSKFATNIMSVNSTLFLDTIVDTYSENNSITLPSSMGLGFVLKNNNKLTAGFDYINTNWSDLKMLDSDRKFENLNSYIVGLEYIPNHISNKYFNTVRYRFGAYFTNTYLKFDSEQINEYGVSCGFGLPIKKSGAIVNLGFEYKQKGTVENNLIKEEYFIFHFNLSLHSIWFVKRKFY